MNIEQIKRIPQLDIVTYDEEGNTIVTEYLATIKEVFKHFNNTYIVIVEESLNSIPKQDIDGETYLYYGADRINVLLKDKLNFYLPYRETLYGIRQELNVENHETLYAVFQKWYGRDQRIKSLGIKTYLKLRKIEIEERLRLTEYIPLKVFLGEWEETDSRYTNYLVERLALRNEHAEIEQDISLWNS